MGMERLAKLNLMLYIITDSLIDNPTHELYKQSYGDQSLTSGATRDASPLEGRGAVL